MLNPLLRQSGSSGNAPLARKSPGALVTLRSSGSMSGAFTQIRMTVKQSGSGARHASAPGTWSARTKVKQKLGATLSLFALVVLSLLQPQLLPQPLNRLKSLKTLFPLVQSCNQSTYHHIRASKDTSENLSLKALKVFIPPVQLLKNVFIDTSGISISKATHSKVTHSFYICPKFIIFSVQYTFIMPRRALPKQDPRPKTGSSHKGTRLNLWGPIDMAKALIKHRKNKRR